MEEVVCADLALPDEVTARYLAPVAERVRAVQLDVTDRTAFIRLVGDLGITHLVHAAAITPDDAQERAQPDAVVDINLGGSTNALAALAACPGLERLLLVSSSGVYGAAGASQQAAAALGSQSEDGPLRLDSLYAVTKRCAELLGERYAAILGRPVAAVRLGPLYGPSGTARPHPSAHHGDPPTGRGAESRPTGARGRPGCRPRLDLRGRRGRGGAAMLLTGAAWSHPVYNVSCGVGYPFRQAVEAFTAHGLRATWVTSADEADVAMRPSQARTPLDITRLREDTGFAPRYDLAAGIDAYLQFAN